MAERKSREGLQSAKIATKGRRPESNSFYTDRQGYSEYEAITGNKTDRFASGKVTPREESER